MIEAFVAIQVIKFLIRFRLIKSTTRADVGADLEEIEFAAKLRRDILLPSIEAGFESTTTGPVEKLTESVLLPLPTQEQNAGDCVLIAVQLAFEVLHRQWPSLGAVPRVG